jgi:hypothetical protein
LRLVVRSHLRCAQRSPVNRRRAQQLVWDWVSAKWPRLRPSLDEMESTHHECALPGLELSMSAHEDGSAWSLSVAQAERHSARVWMTRAWVQDGGDVDQIGLQTACTELAHAPLVIAPPKLLTLWVERLDLVDAGLQVIGDSRRVEDLDQLEAFCAHVESGQRMLPVIALSNNPHSRFYGVDPRGLAEAVRGLAHVACVAPHVAAGVGDRLGEEFALVAGAARVFQPGFGGADDDATRHPLLRDVRPVGEARAAADAGAFRRQLCRRICAMSVDDAPASDVGSGSAPRQSGGWAPGQAAAAH